MIALNQRQAAHPAERDHPFQHFTGIATLIDHVAQKYQMVGVGWLNPLQHGVERMHAPVHIANCDQSPIQFGHQYHPDPANSGPARLTIVLACRVWRASLNRVRVGISETGLTSNKRLNTFRSNACLIRRQDRWRILKPRRTFKPWNPMPLKTACWRRPEGSLPKRVTRRRRSAISASWPGPISRGQLLLRRQEEPLHRRRAARPNASAKAQCRCPQWYGRGAAGRSAARLHPHLSAPLAGRGTAGLAPAVDAARDGHADRSLCATWSKATSGRWPWCSRRSCRDAAARHRRRRVLSGRLQHRGAVPVLSRASADRRRG